MVPGLGTKYEWVDYDNWIRSGSGSDQRVDPIQEEIRYHKISDPKESDPGKR